MGRYVCIGLILLILFGVMMLSVVQRQYYKFLCEEERELEKKLSVLTDIQGRLICEIEKLTTFERLLGSEPSRYEVSFNKVIVMSEEVLGNYVTNSTKSLKRQ
ncbi:MAG: hypothetical protein ABDH28_02495 [Brevinematia bacterium]